MIIHAVLIAGLGPLALLLGLNGLGSGWPEPAPVLGGALACVLGGVALVLFVKGSIVYLRYGSSALLRWRLDFLVGASCAALPIAYTMTLMAEYWKWEPQQILILGYISGAAIMIPALHLALAMFFSARRWRE